MKISKRPDHSARIFFKRTISAQIHLLAFLLAAIGFFALLPFASAHGTPHMWAILIFGVTGMFVFAVSAAYHFLNDGYIIPESLVSILERLDQSAIYLFIAGTYTPVLMNAIESRWQKILMIAVWTFAIAGVLYTNFRHKLPEWAQRRSVYTGVFLVMGFLLLARIGEAWEHMSTTSSIFLIAGSLSYSLGALVYASKRPRLFEGTFGFHELWHLLATVGFIFHYGMISSFYF